MYKCLSARIERYYVFIPKLEGDKRVYGLIIIVTMEERPPSVTERLSIVACLNISNII